jgi:DNA-binding transcriptional LysR family regulator
LKATRFTLRQLEVFVAVAQRENVSRAAVELALSQSAASTALAELERQFDTRLFDRVGKSMRLNETGRVLLPRAVELLERAQEMQDLLSRDGAGDAVGQLRIGATLTIGNYLATLIVADFLRDHPKSRVALDVHNTSTIVDKVANFELDLGLIEGPTRHPDLLMEPWLNDELTVFCAPGHPLAQQRKVALAALSKETWILREQGSGTRETFEQAIRHYPGPLDVRLELEHTEAIKRAVESGLGIGCISRLALREAFRRGSLVEVETPELDLKRQFKFVRHRQKYETAGMRAFLARCRRLTEGVTRADALELPLIP